MDAAIRMQQAYALGPEPETIGGGVAAPGEVCSVQGCGFATLRLAQELGCACPANPPGRPSASRLRASGGRGRLITAARPRPGALTSGAGAGASGARDHRSDRVSGVPTTPSAAQRPATGVWMVAVIVTLLPSARAGLTAAVPRRTLPCWLHAACAMGRALRSVCVAPLPARGGLSARAA